MSRDMGFACRLSADLTDPPHSATSLHFQGHIPAIHTTLGSIKRDGFHRVKAVLHLLKTLSVSWVCTAFPKTEFNLKLQKNISNLLNIDVIIFSKLSGTDGAVLAFTLLLR